MKYLKVSRNSKASIIQKVKGSLLRLLDDHFVLPNMYEMHKLRDVQEHTKLI